MRMAEVADGSSLELGTIDLYSPDLYKWGNPHAVWRMLRSAAPVWKQKGPGDSVFWSFTRYHDVVRILRDGRRFSSVYGTILAVLEGDIGSGKTINLMDPPEHTWVRSPSFRTMSTHAMRLHEQNIRLRAQQMVQRFVEKSRGDFAELVSLLPMITAGPIIGLPEEYWAEAVRWTMAGVAPDDPVFATGTVQDTLRDAHFGLLDIFGHLVQRRRKEPMDDLVSALIDVNFGGRRLTDQEIQLNCYTFTMGANITTSQVLTHLLLVMLDRPELWREIRQDRSLLAGTLDEALRWSTPTNHLLRQATGDIDVNGTLVPKGTLVCAWVASANRDEEVFTDPFVFNCRRQPNPHIGFGSGPHYCIGGPAARVGLTAFLEELIDQVDKFEPAGEPQHLRSNFINGITSLPVLAYPSKTTGRGAWQVP